MLLKRYGTLKEIDEMDADLGIQMIIKAYEETGKDRMWDLYTAIYPNMTEENYISFGEFLHRSKPQPEVPADEILADVKDILDGFHKKKVKDNGDI